MGASIPQTGSSYPNSSNGSSVEVISTHCIAAKDPITQNRASTQRSVLLRLRIWALSTTTFWQLFSSFWDGTAQCFSTSVIGYSGSTICYSCYYAFFALSGLNFPCALLACICKNIMNAFVVLVRTSRTETVSGSSEAHAVLATNYMFTTLRTTSRRHRVFDRWAFSLPRHSRLAIFSFSSSFQHHSTNWPIMAPQPLRYLP